MNIMQLDSILTDGEVVVAAGDDVLVTLGTITPPLRGRWCESTPAT